jgi:hypothetical protein
LPLLLVAIALLAVAILFLALLPLMLVQRYRVGTRRQPARAWLLTVNLVGIAISAALFLLGAAFTTLWVPGALLYSLGGMAAGAVLGVVGLLLTRWEPQHDGLMFTPNRWLVLAIMLVVGGRLFYGLWRAWHAWQSVSGDTKWVASAGIAESLTAGAVALGYYLIYWAGVRRRLSRQRSGR